MRGLFVNNRRAKDSIYESGHMVYRCLQDSTIYALDYCEVDVANRAIRADYDFYLFNFHHITMGWLDTRILKRNLGLVGTIVLEISPNNPFVLCSPRHFSFYCALDPTLPARGNVVPFPRPLERAPMELPVVHNDPPVIGSFGFATKGKGFQHVVAAVNREFDKAVVRINIPFGDFVPETRAYASFLADTCREAAKPGVDVVVTHDFMDKPELIRWCAANTLNCFLYDRNMAGLAATTDQAIVSGRPLSVSDNDTFRHITAYLPPYPKFSLRDSIEKSVPLVQRMQDDWAPARFRQRFEQTLGKLRRANPSRQAGRYYTLPLRTKGFRDALDRKMDKYMKRFLLLGQRQARPSANEVI